MISIIHNPFGRRCLLCAILLHSYLVAGAASPVHAEQKSHTLDVSGSRVHVHIEDADYWLSKPQIIAWVQRAAEIVTDYYGRFPTEQAYIAVKATSGLGIKRGRAIRYGPTINVVMGTASSQEELDSDWILIHELVHLAFPTLPKRHHWIEEGLAVYVESIARANAGTLTPEEVWGGFIKGMPHGLPKTDDRGLDFTPTWGRTYWGGALFCLLADIEIRKTTSGKKTLRDALRGIVTAGFDMTDEIDSISLLLAVADSATGTKELTRLYERMRNSPATIDLKFLWRQLGLVADENGIRFNNHAPLAVIRAAITARDTIRNTQGRY